MQPGENKGAMRVLHVIGAMDRGGAETMIMNLYRAIDRSKVQFDFLVHEDRECDYDDEIRKLGGNIYHVPRFTGANYFAYKKLVRDFFEGHPEHAIVHGHIGSSAAIYLSEAKRTAKYTIAHSHALNYDRGLLGAAFEVASHPTRNIADFFFACSDEAAVDRFGEKVAKGERIRILRNGIDPARYAFDEKRREVVRDELGIAQDAFVVGHVGRLTEVKNHAFLLEAFEHVKREEPRALLLLAGRGELEDELRADAKARGLEDAVLFLGVRDDVPELLMAMDAFAFPSRSEGLPVALVEAQASGLPCIASTGIPVMALISKQARHVPLDAGADAWAQEILAAKPIRRAAPLANRGEGVEDVRAAGFDINQTARWLEEFYLNAC